MILKIRTSSGAILLALLLSDRALAQTQLSWAPLREPGSGGWITSVQISPHNGQLLFVAGDMLGAGRSSDGGLNWGGTFGFRSWEMADFTFHPTNPNSIWLGTMSGPYLSTDGGVNWTEKRNGITAPGGYYTAPIQKIDFDPNNPMRLLAFGGSHRGWDSGSASAKFGAVWESLDAGESWTLKTTILPNSDGRGENIMTGAFAAGSSTVVYCAVRERGVYKSTDGGGSFAQSNSGLPNTDVQFLAVHPTDANTLWACLGSGGAVWKSVDGASSWQASRSGLATTADDGYKTIVVSESNPSILYCANYAYWTGSDGVWRSDDGGSSWVNVMNNQKGNWAAAYPAGPSVTWLEVDPNNPNRVFAAGSEWILESSDGGAAWTERTAESAGNGKWRGRGFSGLVSMNFAFNPYRAGHAAVIAMDAGKMWVSKDDLHTWARQNGLGGWDGGMDAAFSQSNTDLMFAVFGQFSNYDGIARSNDGGDNWSYLSKPAGASGIPTSIYVHPTENNRLWVTVGGVLYYSGNGGDSWSPIDIPGGTQIGWIAAERASPLTMYVSGAGGIFKSSDGSNFAIMPDSPRNGTGRETRIELDPSAPGVVYAANWRAGDNPGLHRYAPGTGWRRILDDSMIANCAVDPSDSDRVVAIANDHPYHDSSDASGVWVTENASAQSPSWTQQNTGLPMLRGEAIEFDPHGSGRLVIGTFGRGFFAASVLTGTSGTTIGGTSTGTGGSTGAPGTSSGGGSTSGAAGSSTGSTLAGSSGSSTGGVSSGTAGSSGMGTSTTGTSAASTGGGSSSSGGSGGGGVTGRPLGLIEGWSIRIVAPKPNARISLRSGSVRRVRGIVSTSPPNQLPRNFSQAGLVQLSAQPEGSAASWQPAQGLSKVSAKGRLKFTASLVGSGLSSGSNLTLRARASTNFGLAASSTSTATYIAR